VNIKPNKYMQIKHQSQFRIASLTSWARIYSTNNFESSHFDM
ncbi:21903_t:CDS:1, partial [Racocetra persica]